jgi:2-phosphoglycerate kinase
VTSDWTVLLIGGTASVGKTNAAKRIATVSGATMLHADDIRLALGIAIPREADLTLEGFRRIADPVSAALENVIAHHLASSDKIVIEGLWITPDLAARTTYGDGVSATRRRGVFVVEDARERTTPLTPFESAHARWVLAEAKRHSLPTVSARPVGHLAERILAVL